MLNNMQREIRKTGAFLSAIIFLCFLVSAIAQDYGSKEERMKITSPEFKHNDFMPKKSTCEGEDVNPQLVIEGAPRETKSLALVVEDPDALRGTWVHWVVYDIPVITRIDENSVPGVLGTNDSSARGDYSGPCPPSGTHRYFFKIYALDAQLNLRGGVNKADLERAMQGHILDKSELIGLYKRTGKF